MESSHNVNPFAAAPSTPAYLANSKQDKREMEKRVDELAIITLLNTTSGSSKLEGKEITSHPLKSRQSGTDSQSEISEDETDEEYEMDSEEEVDKKWKEWMEINSQEEMSPEEIQELDRSIAEVEEELREVIKKEVEEEFGPGKTEEKARAFEEKLENDPHHIRDEIYAKLSGNQEKKTEMGFCKRILNQLSLMSPTADELKIVKDILKIGDKHLDEILKGAHIRIDDNGALYENWKKLTSAHERISSHPAVKGSKQYGVAGPWVHECLFGKVEEDGKVKTFFQLENTPWMPGLKNRLGHSVDSLRYLWGLMKSNIGPYGTSPHVDRNPISLSGEHKAQE